MLEEALGINWEVRINLPVYLHVFLFHLKFIRPPRLAAGHGGVKVKSLLSRQ
jgi:hypothetical protein